MFALSALDLQPPKKSHHFSQMTTVTLYNLETNYNIGVGGHREEKNHVDGEQRFARMSTKFNVQGMRRSVHACILVHMHQHPHVLLLHRKEDDLLMLPGGTLRPDDGDIEGLCRKLSSKLASASIDPPKWDVRELIGQLWRPQFDNQVYPYVPPHITKPKECRKIFLVRQLLVFVVFSYYYYYSTMMSSIYLYFKTIFYFYYYLLLFK